MTPPMGRVATVVALALAVGALPATAAKVERVDVPGGSLRVEIPSTWVRVPPDELELRSLFAAEATDGAAVEVYDAAFQPRGATAADGPPLLLVQGRESGRLSWARFERLPTPDAVDAAAARSLSASGLPFGDTTHVHRLLFDRERYALALDMRIEGTPWGPLEVVSTLYLTATGTVAIHGISRSDAAPPLTDMWRGVMTSVEFDDHLMYRPRARDVWPWMLAWPSTWYVAAALVAAFAAWLVLRERRTRGAS